MVMSWIKGKNFTTFAERRNGNASDAETNPAVKKNTDATLPSKKSQSVCFWFILSFVVQISVQRDFGFTPCGLKKAVLKGLIMGFEIGKLAIMSITSHFPLHLGGCSWLHRNSGSGEIFKWETVLKRSFLLVFCWDSWKKNTLQAGLCLIPYFVDQPTVPIMNISSTNTDAP